MTWDEPHHFVRGTSRCGQWRDALTLEAFCVPNALASVMISSLLIKGFFSLIGNFLACCSAFV